VYLIAPLVFNNYIAQSLIDKLPPKWQIMSCQKGIILLPILATYDLPHLAVIKLPNLALMKLTNIGLIIFAKFGNNKTSSFGSQK